jgi:catechol 2,3-dioxygenase-like lactoylglutathione lyase family enzyme
MLTGIDHLVVAVTDLEQAVTGYRDLGFTVVPGGRHTGIGTYNALIAFQDGSYVELIAFYEPRPDHRWWAALQAGGGLVDYCLQTDDLPGDTLAFRKAGVDIGEPEPKHRTRPDGYQVRWVFSLARGGHRGVAPFIIQDETPREERVPRETTHPNGVTGFGTLTVAVEDAATVAGWYAQVLGRPGARTVSGTLRGAGTRFVIGPHALDLLAPDASGGPLREWLAARGGSPYLATLRGGGRGAGLLPEAKTCGARLRME